MSIKIYNSVVKSWELGDGLDMCNFQSIVAEYLVIWGPTYVQEERQLVADEPVEFEK